MYRSIEIVNTIQETGHCSIFDVVHGCIEVYRNSECNKRGQGIVLYLILWMCRIIEVIKTIQ